MDVSLVLAFWKNVLEESGFRDGAERTGLIAQFLAKNHINKLVHLLHADHPREWLGADCLSEHAAGCCLGAEACRSPAIQARQHELSIAWARHSGVAGHALDRDACMEQVC